MAGGYPLDPNLMNQALAAQGATYRVPVPSAMPTTAPSGLGGLDLAAMPDPMGAQAFAAGLQQQAAAQDTQDAMAPFVRDAQSHGPEAQPQPSRQALTQLPPAMTPPPVWKMGAAAGAPTQAAPQVAPTAVPARAKGMAAPRSPYAGMAAEAGAKAGEAAGVAGAAESAGNVDSALMQDAAQQAGQAQADAGEAIASIEARAAKTIREQNEMRTKAAAIHAAGQAQYLKDIEAGNKAIEGYSPHDDRTRAQKGVGLVAIALSSIGQAFSAMAGQQTSNSAMSVISADVERRLQEQRERLANARTAVGAKQTAMGIAQQMFDQKADQDRFAYALELSAVEKEINAAKAKGMGKEAMARADQVSAEIGMQRDNLLMGLYGDRAERYTTQQTQMTLAKYQEDKARAAAAAAAQSPERQLKLMGQAADIDKTKAETAKLRGDTVGAGSGPFLGSNVEVADKNAYAAWSSSKPSTSEQEKLRVAVQGHAKLMGVIERMRSLKQEYGMEVLPTDAAAEMDAQAEQGFAALNEMKDGSVMNEADYERYKAQLPTSGSWGSSAIRKLDALEQAANTRMNAQLGTLGARLKPSARSLTREGAAK